MKRAVRLLHSHGIWKKDSFLILGIGSDIIDIRRIEKTLDRFGQRFIDRIYTDIEVTKSEKRLNRVESYAKRYAAKEACSKALGTGFRKGVFWRDMGVINLPTGKPTMLLTGGALEQLNRITPAGMKAEIHLTLTDEPPQAQAFVLIFAIPEK